jgi:xanthine dehydrogenase accessory factor
MRHDLFLLASELAARAEPFAIATIVRREAPFSGQSGDMALITQDGAFHGWVGGSCTQPTVLAEALRAIGEGTPRLVALSPDPSRDRRSGVARYEMTCHSGGSVDIYVEPVLPPPRLVVFGVSPIARALARLGKAMGYAVDAVDPAADRVAFPEADRVGANTPAPEPRDGRVVAVVATMGERDEDAVLAAIALSPAYLGVVASAKRYEQMRDALRARGADAATLAAIRSPAGLDIGARTPEQIAVSILAEIVQRDSRPREMARALPTAPSAAAAERDPICGMTVDPATAPARAERDGRVYYFCCTGCRERFLAAKVSP